MSDKTVTMSRELAECMLKDCSLGYYGDELRALLASPVVERQEPVYVLAKQTAVEVPGQERKELGYTLFDGIGVFQSREEVHAAIAELGLPLGWVSMTVDQLLPGYMMPADASPPAPVAVVLTMEDVMRANESVIGISMMTSNQCHALAKALTSVYFDKVKELNQ